jgi:hypothetical protein
MAINPGRTLFKAEILNNQPMSTKPLIKITALLDARAMDRLFLIFRGCTAMLTSRSRKTR